MHGSNLEIAFSPLLSSSPPLPWLLSFFALVVAIFAFLQKYITTGIASAGVK